MSPEDLVSKKNNLQPEASVLQQNCAQKSSQKSIFKDQYLAFLKSSSSTINFLQNISNNPNQNSIQITQQKITTQIIQYLKINSIILHQSASLPNQQNDNQLDFHPQLNGELFGLIGIRKIKQQANLPAFQIIKIKSLFSDRVFRVSVRLLHFTLDIMVLQTLEDPSMFLKQALKDTSGANSTIYFFKQAFYKTEKTYVVKSIGFKTQNLSTVFINTLKEVAISKIASALQFGPFLPTVFGFDMIVHKQSIDFCLQNCSTIKQNGNFNLKIIEADLIDNLRLMHFLKILHLDIKPENIAYSKTFEKWIFIDFGLSEVIVENVGQKSKVIFKGTYFYASEQMKKCFFEQNYVDLYYNDVYGLKKTFYSFTDLAMIRKMNNNQRGLNNCKIRQKQIGSKLHYHRKQLVYVCAHSLIERNYEKFKHVWQILQQLTVNNSKENQQLHTTKFGQLENLQKKFHKSEEFAIILKFVLSLNQNKIVEDIYHYFLENQIRTSHFCPLIQDKIFNRFIVIPNNLSSDKFFQLLESKQTSSPNQLRLLSLLQQFSPSDKNLEQQNFPINNLPEIRKILINHNPLIELQMHNEHYFQFFYNFVTFRKNIFNASVTQKLEVAKIFAQIFDVQSMFLTQNVSFQQKFLKSFSDFKKQVDSYTQDFVRRVFSLCCEGLLSYCSKQLTNFNKSYFLQFVEQYLLLNGRYFTPETSEDVEICQDRLDYFVNKVLTVVNLMSQGKQSKQLIWILKVERMLRLLQFHSKSCVLYSKFKLAENQIWRRNENVNSDLCKIIKTIIFYKQLIMSQNELNFETVYSLYLKTKQQIEIIDRDSLDLADKSYLLESLLIEYAMALTLCAADNKNYFKQFQNQFTSKIMVEDASRILKSLNLSTFCRQKHLNPNVMLYAQMLNDQLKVSQSREVLSFIDDIINYKQLSDNLLPFIRVTISSNIQLSPRFLDMFRQLLKGLNPYNYGNDFFISQLFMIWSLVKMKLQSEDLKDLLISYQKYHFHIEEIIFSVQNQMLAKLVIYLFTLISHFKHSKDSQNCDKTIGSQDLGLKIKFYYVFNKYRFQFFYKQLANQFLRLENTDNLNILGYLQWYQKAILISCKKYTEQKRINFILYENLFFHNYIDVSQQIFKLDQNPKMRQQILVNFKYMEYQFQIHLDSVSFYFNRFEQFQRAFISNKNKNFYFLQYLSDFLNQLRLMIFSSTNIVSFQKCSSSPWIKHQQKVEQINKSLNYYLNDLKLFKLVFRNHLNDEKQLQYPQSKIVDQLSQKYIIKPRLEVPQPQQESLQQVQTSQDKKQKIKILLNIIRQGIQDFCCSYKFNKFDWTNLVKYKPIFMIYVMLYFYHFSQTIEEKKRSSVDVFIVIFFKSVPKDLDKRQDVIMTESFINMYSEVLRIFYNILIFNDNISAKRIKEGVQRQIQELNPSNNKDVFAKMDKVWFVLILFRIYTNHTPTFYNKYECYIFLSMVQFILYNNQLIILINSDFHTIKNVIFAKTQKFNIDNFSLKGDYPLREFLEKVLSKLILSYQNYTRKPTEHYSSFFLQNFKQDLVICFLALAIKKPQKRFHLNGRGFLKPIMRIEDQSLPSRIIYIMLIKFMRAITRPNKMMNVSQNLIDEISKQLLFLLKSRVKKGFEKASLYQQRTFNRESYRTNRCQIKILSKIDKYREKIQRVKE